MNKKYNKSKICDLVKERNIELISDYTASKKRHTWNCKICNHFWIATPSNVLGGSGCPFCAGFRQDINSLKEMASFMGIQCLETAYHGQRKDHLWACPNGHTWRAKPYHIKLGTGCPSCGRGIKEEQVRFILEQLTKEEFPSNHTVLKGKELDGYCSKLNLAFEYNGKQHYEFVPFFHRIYNKFEEQVKRDIAKTEACQKATIIKFDIAYHEAVNQDSLVKHITKLLKDADLPIRGKVNWKKFHGKRKFLKETIANAEQINAVCLSKVYFTAKTKLEFQCKECGYIWRSTPSNIKTGYGCIKCSYKFKRWNTRRDKQCSK